MEDFYFLSIDFELQDERKFSPVYGVATYMDWFGYGLGLFFVLITGTAGYVRPELNRYINSSVQLNFKVKMQVSNNKVFIIHGHDENTLNKVVRLIGLLPVS